MERANNSPLWIFLHIPKTGGTTFTGHLYHHFKWDEEFVHIGPWGAHFNKQENKIPFEERPIKERECAKVVGGHFTYWGIHSLVPNKTPRYIVFLRDPADRLVSIYNFTVSRGETPEEVSFENWYTRYRRNEQVLWLNKRNKKVIPWLQNVSESATKQQFEIAKDILRECWFVGITNELNDDLEILCQEMGLPSNWKNYRVAGEENQLTEIGHPSREETLIKHYYLTEEMRLRIYKENDMDYELFQLGKQLNQQMKSALAHDE